MDLDVMFVASLLNAGKTGIRTATEKGIVPEALFGEGRIAYEFILEYTKQYGEVPARESIEGHTGVVVPVEVPGPVAFFADTIVNRSVSGRLRKKLLEWEAPLGEGQGMVTLEAIESEIRTIPPSRSPPVPNA